MSRRHPAIYEFRCEMLTAREIRDKYKIPDLAALGEMHKKGFDWQRRCEIEAADLDSLCVDMCYVQLSLIGARACVRHMDTLSGRHFETYETPMMCIGPL